MASFPRALVVDIGASVGASYELAKPFCAGEPDPFRFRKASCDIRMGTTEQVRQKRQRIGFVGCRIELQLVAKSHGCHVAIVTESVRKETQPRAQSRSRPSMDAGRPPETALRGPMQIGCVLTHLSDFEDRQ